MQPARIAELLAPFLCNPCHSDRTWSGSDGVVEEPAVLSPAQLQHISTYIDVLLHWNARINLTAIRDPEQIVTRHFGESLFAARHLFPAPPVWGQPPSAVQAEAYSAARVADLGAGAGFPGLPIKLWAPHIYLTLIESNHKKVAFLREVVRFITLTNVDVFPGRAEDLVQPGRRSRLHRVGKDEAWQHDSHEDVHDANCVQYDLVTLRGVERFAHVLPVAASLLAPAGRLALLVGSSQLQQVRLVLPHLAWDDPVPVPQSTSRCLLVGLARPGMVAVQRRGEPQK